MTVRTSTSQRLRSSFLFVQLTDGPGWVGFREVLEVNGKRVGPDQRSGTALEAPGESALDRWRRLSEESARYNIGSITRTLNVPTFALLVLHAANQSRFSFKTAGGDGATNPSACDVVFQETDSPTIIRNSVGGDVPASGTFRIAAGDRSRRSVGAVRGKHVNRRRTEGARDLRARSQAAAVAAEGDARGGRGPVERAPAVCRPLF